MSVADDIFQGCILSIDRQCPDTVTTPLIFFDYRDPYASDWGHGCIDEPKSPKEYGQTFPTNWACHGRVISPNTSCRDAAYTRCSDAAAAAVRLIQSQGDAAAAATPEIKQLMVQAAPYTKYYEATGTVFGANNDPNLPVSSAVPPSPPSNPTPSTSASTTPAALAGGPLNSLGSIPGIAIIGLLGLFLLSRR